MRTNENALLIPTTNFVNFNFSQVYVLVGIIVIGLLLRCRKLKPTEAIAVVKRSEKPCFVSTEEMLTRIKLFSTSNPVDWKDVSEYNEDIGELYSLVHFIGFSVPDLWDMSYEYYAEGLDGETVNEIVGPRFTKAWEEYEKNTPILLQQVKQNSKEILKKSYCCLNYWPYAQWVYDYSFTDEVIREHKIFLLEQIKAN